MPTLTGPQLGLDGAGLRLAAPGPRPPINEPSEITSMNLGKYLAQKAAGRIIADKHMRTMRAEHDAWASAAKLGSTFYTAAPVGVYDELTGRRVHLAYRFVTQGKGIWVNQLLDERGCSSWQVWRDHGPLTSRKMPTVADCQAEDERAFAGFVQRAHDKIAADAYEEIKRLFPVSTELLAAA